MFANAVDLFYAALALGFLGLMGVVIWKIFNNEIDLSRLISEDDGKASLSRFQLLLFTFVVAGAFLVLSLEAGQFVDVPTGVQVLLGISGGGFVVSKAVGAAKTSGNGKKKSG